jgi:hypothetical protein
MSLVVAATFSMCAWIVLWAIGFGRVGDAFIISFVPVMLVVAAFRHGWLGLSRRSGR